MATNPTNSNLSDYETNPHFTTGNRMGGRKLDKKDIFSYLKELVKLSGLLGKKYSTDSNIPYVCTTFLSDCLSLLAASQKDYLPGGQKVIDSIALLEDLINSNGKNPKKGLYIFYFDYGDGTGHTGFVEFDEEGDAEILHNGSDGNGNQCVNIRTRDSRDFYTWFNDDKGKLYYKEIEVDIWIE